MWSLLLLVLVKFDVLLVVERVAEDIVYPAPLYLPLW